MPHLVKVVLAPKEVLNLVMGARLIDFEIVEGTEGEGDDADYSDTLILLFDNTQQLEVCLLPDGRGRLEMRVDAD